MPIPKEILAVPRPVNTVVSAYGKDKNLYAVRQRVGCKNVGGRHVPVTGPTIGHIVDWKYEPLEEVETVSSSAVDLKDWANVVLCDRVFGGMMGELEAVYAHDDALRIYCISILRVCEAGIKDHELKEAYETGFLSELYPGVALSKNTVSTFLNNLGKTCSRITAFMRGRASEVALGHHLLIDGTLKSDESRVNSLSDYSRKARLKGSRDISVLYAFDLEKMEPVCSKCFPGNMLDITAYEAFLSECGISKGVIVTDKGFPSSSAQGHFKANPDLHFMNPVKRNAKLIDAHHMMELTGILRGYEGVTYRKEQCEGKSLWLYSYRDARRASKEERDYLARAKSKGTYNLATFKEKQRSFGTVVLECDLDLDPETAYKTYEQRWEIEIVMRYYKSACEFDETRVQDDYSVIGSEFCDFLSTVLTFRLINEFDKAGLFEAMNYRKILSVLRRAKKARLDGNDWKLIKLNPSQERMLQALGLTEQPQKPLPRKRGRPKKSGV